MNAVLIISLILLAGLVVFALCKLGTLESRIDDIYNKALTMQGEIEANTARAKDNYKLIAQVNTKVEEIDGYVKELQNAVDVLAPEPTDEIAKEVVEELESVVAEQEQVVADLEEIEESTAAYELSVRRENFAHLRGLGKSVKEAGEIVGVSYSTAKRYEKWRVDNKK